ncbi:MAG: hypothetical protein A49_11340 [Methyloceanibacter sp.]|nr:MAG: hypothetical protein A49_11340 [Methyloceanibacter sp.]
MSAVAVLRWRKTWTTWAGADMQTLFRISTFSSAAVLAAALWAAPAVAESGTVGTSPDDPMTIVISLPNQKAHIYRGTSLITTTAVSTGKRGHSTKAGIYSILEKRRRHYSNLYNGAPMPWMQRLTWTGTALHAGVVPGYPASHGCVRLPYSFAPKLFSMTEVGEQVVVAHSMLNPEPITHPALFQPLPPPMPPELLTQDSVQAKPMRKSSLEVPAGKTFGNQVILAKATALRPKETGKGEASAKFALIPETTGSIAPAQSLSGSLDDTTHHAIDPGAAPFMGSGAHALTAKPRTGSGVGPVEAEQPDDVMKHQDRLADHKEPKGQDRLTATDEPAGEAGEIKSASLPEPAVAAGPVSAPNLDESPALESPETAAEAATDVEPAAQPILTVSADPVQAKAQKSLQVSLSVLGVNDHPPVPLERPSVMVSRLTAGIAAAAVEAAEPLSQEPLRILVTRRTERDRTVDVQYMLADMGYLAPQNFDGTRGSATVRALKAFQKDNELPETGALTEDMIEKIYEVAGKTEPPEGQLFVRQKFASVFSTPVSIEDPDKPLGTHLFTVMHFAPGATEANWTAISLNDKETAESVLNRIEIPDDVRQKISERLTPGSSLIVADTAINSAALPKGADFLVWDTSKGSAVQRASVSPQPSRRASTQRRAAPSYARQRDTRQRYSRRSAPQRRGFFPF